MSYKISGVEFLKDDNTVAGFQNVTVENFFVFSKGIGTDTTTGYTCGGFNTPTSARDTIDKYPFVNLNLDASDVGELTQSRSNVVTAGSSTHGYCSGGQIPTTTVRNTIDKFSFATDGDATDVGDLTASRRNAGGNQDGNKLNNSKGFVTGGQNTPSGSPTFFNIIDSFPFATDANATDAGDLGTTVRQHASQSSETHAYSSGGGEPSPANTNEIQRFPFSSTNTSSDVGDLTQARRSRGMSSDANGYSAGTVDSPQSNAVIDKYPFATNANASDVGDLIDTNIAGTGNGTSSEDYGYQAGGTPPSPGGQNIIQRFSFVTDGNATDVGNLSQTRGYTGGVQG